MQVEEPQEGAGRARAGTRDPGPMTARPLPEALAAL